MDENKNKEQIIFLEEEVKTKLAVFLQAEFDLDTHKKDSSEKEFTEKLASAKKEWLEAKDNLAAVEKKEPDSPLTP